MIIDGPFRWFQEIGYRVLVIQGTDKIDVDNDNVDVEVRFDSGTRYVGTFFTLNNIRHLMEKWECTQECCAGGLYFWASDMVIVEKLTYETILGTVRDLISSGTIEQVLSRCDTGPV